MFVPMKHCLCLSALLVGILFASQTAIRADDVVCTEEGCHHLDPSVKVSAAHLDRMLASLKLHDPALADGLRAALAQQPQGVQDWLDAHCLLQVSINAESRVKVDAGAAEHKLQAGAWQTYLVRIQNLAGVTAPLTAHSKQARPAGTTATRSRWFELEMLSNDALSNVLSGAPLEYLILRLRTDAVGKRSAVIAMDVGQGTADIGFRNDVLLTFDCVPPPRKTDPVATVTPRRPRTDDALRRWLQNMIWHHDYTATEIELATGLRPEEVSTAAERFAISQHTKPTQDPNGPLKVLPYPGGRHPRIGFLDGAIDPQRETKISVFTPWDDTSYVVADIPEAIWSNLGLTYLAHSHIPTIWDKAEVQLAPLEWQLGPSGQLTCERTLPNGIVFGTEVTPKADAVTMNMWLTNGTSSTLSGLRVQNCVMLKAAKGFDSQSNDNKIFWGPYAACHDDTGTRWVITAWDPVDRVWGNEACPCLHADPQFPECAPKQTQHLRGHLSFYAGDNIYPELLRLESTSWRYAGRECARPSFIGGVFDAETGEPLPARVHLRKDDGEWYLLESLGGAAVSYDRRQPNLPESPDVHTALSPDPFAADLPPGTYEVRVEHGKEYLPVIDTITIGDKPITRAFHLQRWINMADRGWYSGDTHVHRSLAELPTAMLAEGLNVAFPLTYWITHAHTPPQLVDDEIASSESHRITLDDTHVIYPRNTEYEIFDVGDRPQTLGAVLILNHESTLSQGVPPTRGLAERVRAEGALLDLDKHTWPWSFMIAPIMQVDLFELANNHVWQTRFGLPRWALDTAPDYMSLERDEHGFTERGWIDYGFQTYYALVNCGLRMRVSAGTAAGVHPVPLGFGRVYVNVPNSFSYDQWIDGLDAGRSFVSTGPMLDLRFNGQHAGHTFSVSNETPAVVHIAGLCEARRPLERIELVVNGQVVRVITPQNRQRQTGAYTGGFVTELDEHVERSGSYWLAVRCFEQHPEGRVRFAHTNPVYVDVPNDPVRPRKCEVGYFVRRLEEEIDRVKDILPREALEEYEEALKWYQNVARNAR